MDIRLCFCDFFLVIFVLCIHGGLSNMEDDYEDGPSFGRCPWIRNKLKNGRVKYRYRGRVAKFICDAGFELAGKRSSTCVRGQWTNPVPVCVARGCSPVPPIPNGRVTEMYRGALLVYDCNPGYTLDGETSIHCNGRRWSTAPPLCNVATETPETQCDFESPDLCGWTHDPSHDFDWQRNQFSTPSGHVGTGPAFDHTFGENKAGYYLYIEASSPRKVNDTARLFSPVYPEDLSGGCFVLWYHMYGATTGGLRIYLKPESYVFDELKPTWVKYGDQGNLWQRGSIIIPVVHENFQIVIEGVRGESYVGDSAIDDVWLTLNTCESIENSTEITENTAQDSCRGRCREKESGEACGCNDTCFAESACCSDYLTICGAGNDTLVQSTDEPLPGDYFGKTSSLVTTTLFHTTEKSSEEEITTAASKETTELDSTSKSINDLDVNGSLPAKTLTSIEISNFTTLPTIQSVNSSNEVSLSSKEPTTVSLKNNTTTAAVYVTSSTSTELTTLFKNSATISAPSTSSTMTSSTPSTTSSLMTMTSITTSTVTTPSTTESQTGIFQSTTIPISTPLSSTLLLLTSKPIIRTTNSTLPYSTELKSTLGSTNNYQTTVVPLSSPISTVTSTTRTYNLRPRTQRTTSSSTPLSTLLTTSSLSSKAQLTTTTNIPLKEVTSTTSAFKTNVPYSTTAADRFIASTASTFKTNAPYSTTIAGRFIPITTSTFKTNAPYSTITGGRFIASYSTRTIKPATETTTKRSIMPKLTTSDVLYVSKTTIPNIPPTTKFVYRITKSTESTSTTTSDFYESGASKSKTSANNGSAPIVIALVVVVIVCVVGGLIYYMKKRRSIRQSKLSDDSEMRFLPESDYNDYSDASALDRIFK